jgi:predicted nucleic-acid-binding protein
LKAVDTNILVRLIIEDDDEQVSRARAFCAAGVIVSLTVAMETEWVLRSRYKLARESAFQFLRSFVDSANFHFSREAGVRWALDRYRAGADFADMIHLLDAHDADGFATFDEDFATGAGSNAPLPVIAI